MFESKLCSLSKLYTQVLIWYTQLVIRQESPSIVPRADIRLFSEVCKEKNIAAMPNNSKRSVLLPAEMPRVAYSRVVEAQVFAENYTIKRVRGAQLSDFEAQQI